MDNPLVMTVTQILENIHMYYPNYNESGIPDVSYCKMLPCSGLNQVKDMQYTD